jgi:succinate dehydrogenase assembly factor 2
MSRTSCDRLPVKLSLLEALKRSMLAFTTSRVLASATRQSRHIRPLAHKAFRDATSETFTDPWPLPGSPEHISSTLTPLEELKISPLERPNESIDNMRARLVYQTRKRGTLESDLLLSTFGDEWLHGMDEEELKEFDKVCYSITMKTIYLHNSVAPR